MAKGYDKDRERKAKVSFFGKDLARRSKSTCELCEASGVKLNVYEVPPIEEEPSIDRCVLLCESCTDTLERLTKAGQNDLRFFNNTIWSEVPMVKALSIAALRKLEDKHPWASDILENAYIDEETEELIASIEL